MAALVTGIAGFIGSHVAASLLASGKEVVGIDDLSGGFSDNVPEGVAFNRGSVLDERLLARIFSDHKIDTVYHLAAYAAEGLSHFIRGFNYENNVVGSMRVLNAAIRAECRCFVFTSSIAVYGTNRTPLEESLPPRPEDPYGIAKAAVEWDLAAAQRLFGIDYVIFRPHNVYGERQRIGDRYRNVIGIFMNQIMRGQSMTIFGDGAQERAFTYISDVAPIIAHAPEVAKARNQIFNIGADEPTTVQRLAEEVADAMNATPRIVHLESREEVRVAIADHSKVRAVFDYRQRVDLRTGLRRMAEWARAVGPREPTIFDGVEIVQNLPPSWRMASR